MRSCSFSPPGFHMLFSLPGTTCFLANSSYPGAPADMALPVEDLGSQPHLPGAAWTPSPCRTITVWWSLPDSVVNCGLWEGRGLLVTWSWLQYQHLALYLPHRTYLTNTCLWNEWLDPAMWKDNLEAGERLVGGKDQNYKIFQKVPKY